MAMSETHYSERGIWYDKHAIRVTWTLWKYHRLSIGDVYMCLSRISRGMGYMCRRNMSCKISHINKYFKEKKGLS
jgi:hypothetical protein